MITILVVDDQPITRELLVTLLGYEGYRLVEAANGVEALERAGAESPDLIIADILMPTMDGYEFVHHLRAEPTLSQIPIIFYTAHYGERESLALAQACGVNYVLRKPSQLEVILQTVEAALNLALPEISSPLPEMFDREHVRLLTDKLSQKVEELQGVNDRLIKLYAELQRHVEKLEREMAERKQVEEALRVSQEQFRQVAVSISDHVYMTEVSGAGAYKNRYISPNVEKLTGYNLEKFETDWNFWRCLIHLDDQATAATQVETLRQGRNSEVEYRLNRADGAVIWVRDSARVESRGGAQIIYGVVGNITLRKQVDVQIRHLGTRLEHVAEMEKRQLSRELHNQVGQSTTTLALDLTMLQSLLPPEAIEAKAWLAQALTEVKTITAAVRGVMHELRPPELDDYGLIAALEWYAQQFGQRSGLPITIEAVELTPRLPLETETALFRITQEALTNVLKHARASQVTISLERLAQGMRLVIADNGLGFTPKELEAFRPSVKERGWGLLTMRERAFAIGAELTATSAPGQGTRIIVDVKR